MRLMIEGARIPNRTETEALLMKKYYLLVESFVMCTTSVPRVMGHTNAKNV